MPVACSLHICKHAFVKRQQCRASEVLSLCISALRAAIGSENEDGSKKFVIRPYTPTSVKDAKGYFDLVVKVYPEGKMSKHFGDMKVPPLLVPVSRCSLLSVATSSNNPPSLVYNCQWASDMFAGRRHSRVQRAHSQI